MPYRRSPMRGTDIDLVATLRREGGDAFAKHYSLGMWKLCADAADEIDSLRLERDALLAALTRLEAHVRILPPEYDGEGSPLAQARAALTASKATGERS
jgi:hypothetical protein